MYLAICDDDILLCANLRRKLAAFDTGGNKLLVDEYHSGEELLKCVGAMLIPDSVPGIYRDFLGGMKE